MPKRPDISKGEISVVRAVWHLKRATVGAVYDEVSRRENMDYSTVQTYLRRLENKGYLSTKRDGRNKLYSPKVQATQVISSIMTDLVDRLFDGQVLAMMNHLVSNHRLGPEDLEELRRFIAQQEGARDAS